MRFNSHLNRASTLHLVSSEPQNKPLSIIYSEKEKIKNEILSNIIDKAIGAF